MKLYTVNDMKAQIFLAPFTEKNDLTARRVFTVACRESGSMFNTNPEDYLLVAIGEYDEDTGIVKAYKSPEPVCRATECVVQSVKEVI